MIIEKSLNMEKEIFNNANPFTVPDGYFDTLQEHIMNRIATEESRAKKQGRMIRMHSYWRALVAVAACILFIFVGASLYMTHSNKQSLFAETVIDEEFYRWLYASDDATFLAEALDIPIPENYLNEETEYSEENEAIIQFLERDNISLVAIVYSLNNESLYIP